MNIFITSDLHFNHNKDFIYGSRGFSSTREHDEVIIERWNSIVTPKDEIWFLGDIGMGTDIKYLKQQVSRLNGFIYWLEGNHDTDRRWGAISTLSNVCPESGASRLRMGTYRFWLSHYPTMTAPIGEKDWKHSLISLCGQAHTKNRFSDWKDYMIYHAELDAHNCYPVPIEEIIEDIKNHEENS